MAMLHVLGPLMGVKDPGKVPNRKVAKPQIVLLLILVLVLDKKFALV